MSTTEHDVPTGEHPEAEVHSAHHEHPSDWLYVQVAMFLAFVTALEVGTYVLNVTDTKVLVIFLFPLMIIKFGTVIWFFMHLKYDSPLFRRVFLFGLSLATVVFLIMLSTFAFWTGDYYRFIR